MKVLVTGGAGYIGSHTAQVLLERDHQVVVLDNLSTGFQEAIPPGCEFVQGDIRDTNFVVNLLKSFKIEAVVHFAAKLIVPESIDKPYDYYDNNVNGVLSMVNACRQTGVDKFVFSSTAAVYGETEKQGLINETDPTGPTNPYGASKLMSERILLDSEKPYGLKTVCLRYFNVAGAHPHLQNGQRTKAATHLIKVASEAACGKRASVGIFGTDYKTVDGSGVRDYIHVVDLAQVHALALQYLSDGGSSQIFNCGYGEGFSVKQVLSTMRTVSNVEFKTVEEKRRQGDVASLVADSTKAQKTLKWTPRHNDLNFICKTAYEWEKKLTQV